MKTKKNMYRITIFLLSIFLFMNLISLVACGGGGAGGGASTTSDIRDGIFLDSPVAGLDYRTPTLSGKTDARGTFKYRSGEIVSFSIGSVVLGQAVAKEKISPIDLVAGSTESDPAVTNICRLLQSLDADGDLINGIQISPAIANEVDGRPLDFFQSTTDFENDPDLQALLNILNARGMFADGNKRTLRTVVAAQNHLKETLDGNNLSVGANSGSKAINNDAFYKQVRDTISKEGIDAAIALIKAAIRVGDYLVLNDGEFWLVTDIDIYVYGKGWVVGNGMRRSPRYHASYWYDGLSRRIIELYLAG